MKRFYENKIFAYVAIALVIINMIMTFIVIVPSLAVSTEGFISASEAYPPNNILFKNKTSGVTNAYSNVFLCCGTRDGYSGAIFASTGSMDGFNVFNMSGPVQISSTTQYEYNYNGTIVYLFSGYMSGGRRDDNNYQYAEFNTDFSPINQIAINFYEYVISNGGGGNNNVSSTLNYNLPAGNVAFVEIGDGVPNISMMSTVMPVKSAAFSSETGWNSTQRVGFAESLPSSGDNLASFGSQIEWIPDGNANIFGQTQNAKYTAPSLSGHKYLVVVNPLYYAIQYTNGEGIASTEPGVNSTVNNNSVNIFMNYSKGITVYQLTQNVTINNNIPTYSNDVSSGPYEGDIDPDTGDVTWTDPEGGSSQPTTGGGNVPSTGENNFNSFLSGVANRIVNVFQPAHDAILTLSNAVQNIAGWMYALYVWLPAPVLSILTSAISLAIIIGLIKVFV